MMEDTRPRTRITILVDNNAQPGKGLVAEHGFAALIEQDNNRVMFDTGQGPALVQNSRILGVELSPITLVALSHGHYDHTGGLGRLARLNRSLRVAVHPDALAPHSALEAPGVKFEFVTDFKELLPGFWITGPVPQIYEDRLDWRLYTRPNNHVAPDPVRNEVSLIVHTKSGWIALIGCAHPGLGNILEYASQVLDIHQFQAVIGGTHLSMMEIQKTPEAIEVFDRFDVQSVATCHCTGAKANAAFKAHFGHKFANVFAGAVFEF
jgi:7,8-dihydropterin-6-yl-methyl-4-(beta-D-ribofuranosyl)aminobenzene 5'-phosphate synthase